MTERLIYSRMACDLLSKAIYLSPVPERLPVLVIG